MSATEPGRPERGVWLRDDSSRNDLAVFAERARALDATAVCMQRSQASRSRNPIRNGACRIRSRGWPRKSE